MATDTREIDPIRGYLDAVQAYEQERTKAKTLIDRISTVANAMQNHLPDFLGLNYSLAASMTAGDRSRPIVHFALTWTIGRMLRRSALQ